MKPRVVITGVGAITPVGVCARASFEAMLEGRSGIRELSGIVPGMGVTIGGQVRGFVPPSGATRDEGVVARFAQFALVAAREAIEDSGFRNAGYRSDRVAAVLGVGSWGIELLQGWCTRFRDAHPSGEERSVLHSLLPTSAVELIAREAQATGPAYCVVSACASSAHAIGEGLSLLRSGSADVVFAGGAESSLTPLGVTMFERIGSLSKRNEAPQSASRPFDRDRDGFVMSEGGAVVVLETLDGARKRGAPVYAEVAGYGASADAFHVTRPRDDGDGMASAMRQALAAARVCPQEVEYINAHGTGTLYNDTAETAAIKRVFGEHARSLWISSNKSTIGHLLGGAAAVETVATALTIRMGAVPPTINLEHPDPRCDLDYVASQARSRKVRVAIKNSFGFGGQNACLVLKAI